MAQTTQTASKTAAAAPPVLQALMVQGRMARDPSQVPYAHEMLQEFATQAAAAGTNAGTDAIAFIQRRVQALDAAISAQLDQIMHAPEFQALEGSWRGLAGLVAETDDSAQTSIRVLNASKEDLSDDFEATMEFDQSALFKKIYEQEYGTFGGKPYSCLIGDYAFSNTPQDLALLEQISHVASAALAPFISSASPDLLNLDSFSDIDKPTDFAHIFQGAQYAKWNGLRQLDDARYLVLTLPRVLARLPYGQKSNPVRGIDYEETVSGTDNSTFCWGNAAYKMGECIVDSFLKYNWCAAIRGVEGGGKVDELPTYTYQTSAGDVAIKCPTETAITDRRENELSGLGFLPLCYCKNTDYAAFFSSQTVQQPATYDTNEANANSALSARLSYMLAACRFGHYIKAMMRDKIGRFMSAGDVQTFLQKWLAQYVILNDNAPQDLKAKFPLREGRVEVSNVPGKPGSYTATVFLRPHFQLEELTASLRLVADLPASAAK